VESGPLHCMTEYSSLYKIYLQIDIISIENYLDLLYINIYYMFIIAVCIYFGTSHHIWIFSNSRPHLM